MILEVLVNLRTHEQLWKAGTVLDEDKGHTIPSSLKREARLGRGTVRVYEAVKMAPESVTSLKPVSQVEQEVVEEIEEEEPVIPQTEHGKDFSSRTEMRRAKVEDLQAYLTKRGIQTEGMNREALLERALKAYDDDQRRIDRSGEVGDQGFSEQI